MDVGILSRRAASEKPFASTTLANIISELRSVIVILPVLQVADHAMPVTGRGVGRMVMIQAFDTEFETTELADRSFARTGQVLEHYPKFGKYICSFTR